MKNLITGSNALIVNKQSVGLMMIDFSLSISHADTHVDVSMHNSVEYYLEKLYPGQKVQVENTDFDGQYLRVDFNLE